MEAQSLINVAIAVAGFFGGWVLKRITDSLDRLDADVRAMPEKYVAKDDYKDDIKRVQEMLDKIFCKLDGKADK